MSEFRVERLNALLSKVQENRKKPRPARGAGTTSSGMLDAAPRAPEATRPATAAHADFRAPAAAAPSPMQAARAALAQADSSSREHEAATEVAPRPPEDRVIKSPPPPPPRRPFTDRRPTPLEMAVAGELDRDLVQQPAPTPQALRAPALPGAADARREAASGRSLRAGTAPIPDAAAQQPIVPRVIEPDPPREVNRPIAQVASKHAPPVDATFGAMLKRSLTLRPH